MLQPLRSTKSWAGSLGDDNAKAEIIDANLISEIIRKMPMNQTYYGKMSELLKRLIGERRLGALSYAEYLRQVTELARRIHSPEETENYPVTIRDSQAKRALYDFAKEESDFDGLDIEDVASQVHLAIVDVAEVGWLSNRAKQQRIKNAIAQTLEDYELLETRIDQLVEEIYELATRQEEYFDY